MISQDRAQMSVKVMGQVWDADLPRPEKFVLLAYVCHAQRDDPSIRRSVGRIAWQTGYSRRSVQQITQKLLDREILVQIGTSDAGVKEYRIDTSKLPRRIDPSETEFVYVIKAIDYDLYKIGCTSRTPNRRLAEFCPKLPFKTRLVCTIEDDNAKNLEARLHKKFGDKRTNGEWFELGASDVAYILGMESR
jgi:hypothetical protein